MDIMEAQPDVRPATKAEMLEQELKYAPTHMVTEDGIVPITEKPSAPSPILVALMEDAPMLVTGAVWADMAMAAKIDIAIEIGAPVEADPDVFSAMPEESRLWLMGWQMQVNSGSCWNTAGSIGRTASELIDEGFLLLGKTPTRGFYSSVPGRDQVVSGAKGSPSFVRRMMGDAYLAWISAIE